MLAEPIVFSTQISQVLHGHAADVIDRDRDWRKIRSADGYEGWAHEAYFADPVMSNGSLPSGWNDPRPLSLGCTVRETSGVTKRLPLGALVEERDVLTGGTAISLDERRARFPRDGEAITRTALELFEGTWYMWGGVTPWGCDCSGLVQSSFALHGVSVRRDAVMQATQGVAVEGGLEDLRPADLLFFSDREDGFITHVAISLGGTRVVHLTLYRGGHGVDDLAEDSERLRGLRGRFRFARRIL